MADIETSVAITAQVDDLLSGMKSAADAVETAVGAIKAQFSDLSSVAQNARSEIAATATQIESTIGALQANTVSLTGPLRMPTGQANDLVGTGLPGPRYFGYTARQHDSQPSRID